MRLRPTLLRSGLAALALASMSASAQTADSYADAMQVHTPLAKVAGAPRTMAMPRADDPRFAAAVDYAAATDSYALLIWQGGKLRTAHYFAPHDATLRPESASMHKSVLALAVVAAIADGKIHSADDPLARYIPEWAKDARGRITVRQVLNMATGLKPPPLSFSNDGDKARATLLGLEVAAAPGTGFQYANAFSQILVLVLEKATGRPYADYLSARIWKRVHADDAYVWLNEPTGFPRGYTALMAHATDWLRIGLLIKDRGRVGGSRVLPAALIDQMTAPSATNPDYGWQIWRGATYQPDRFYNDAKVGASVKASAPFAADDILYFDGFGGQRVYISRSKDLVIVRQGAMRLDWDDAMLPNLVIGALGK
jgi:CubicO group peptidase (beta-lactamase class C family)